MKKIYSYLKQIGINPYAFFMFFIGLPAFIRDYYKFKMLKPGGIFYFAVPIGRQRIEFNAHRVFDVDYLVKLFKPLSDIVSFSYVDDQGDIHEDLELLPDMTAQNFGCKFGFGIFELRKK